MTPPAPSRDSAAGRAFNDLRNLAARAGRDPAEYYTLYALEGFLRRLTVSAFANDFVLKGGVLMAAFAGRRPTRDIDLAASGISNDIPAVEQRVRQIVAIPAEDGLVFSDESVVGQTIREAADFSGVRVKVVALLGAARIPMHVDVNFGDPIWPRPTEAVLPLLLGGDLRLNGYPDHMVLAEKIVTAIERGRLNTRWRDFVDIAAIIRHLAVRYSDLRPALEVVASHRGFDIVPLGPLLAGMPDVVQAKWAVWRRKQRLEATTPARFADLVQTCLLFTEPVLTGNASGLVWDFVVQAWTDEGIECEGLKSQPLA